MSTPQRILDSDRFRTFMEWFELFAIGVFLLVIMAILFATFYWLFWWLA